MAEEVISVCWRYPLLLASSLEQTNLISKFAEFLVFVVAVRSALDEWPPGQVCHWSITCGLEHVTGCASPTGVPREILAVSISRCLHCGQAVIICPAILLAHGMCQMVDGLGGPALILTGLRPPTADRASRQAKTQLISGCLRSLHWYGEPGRAHKKSHFLSSRIFYSLCNFFFSSQNTFIADKPDLAFWYSGMNWVLFFWFR